MNPTLDHSKLYEFLQRFEPIWGDSILQNWPLSRSYYPLDWLNSVMALSPSDLHDFANGHASSSLHPDLRALLAEAQSFELRVSGEEVPLDKVDVQGLNDKKQHEVRRLFPVLTRLGADVTHAVDIGGGVGHLARLCVKHFQWRFHTIDKDVTLQTKGEWWLKRSRDFDRSKLSFVAGELKDEASELDRYFSETQTLSLGLHTCGSLAVYQFRKSLGSQRLINFGCCYDKTRPEELNLSEFGKSHPIAWNPSSLFLATRGRNSLDDKEFKLLRRVNDHRFAFHLFVKAHYPQKGFLVAGDAPKSLYEQPFSVYANDRLLKLGLNLEEKERLEEFYRSTQNEVFEIFAAHLIRNIFARPLELFLLSDRVLWLNEQGFHAELQAVFDRDLSPRNVAIIARR
ncbi:MAG: methyltransferase [Proteobacteria bacterium]|nr:MAG: methyltransferase [Pseudomonadota bacterium]